MYVHDITYLQDDAFDCGGDSLGELGMVYP